MVATAHTQKTKISNNSSRIASLEREVSLLRSAIVSLVGKNPEGEYRPEFVREILKAAKEKPTRRFKDPDSFLASHLSRFLPLKNYKESL